MWDKRWGKTVTGKGFAERILPAIDEFTTQNPEKMFVEDNARPHTEKFCMAEKDSRPWIRVEWPPNSPDLNPIENIWRRMKEKIYKGPNPPKKIGDLREAVLKAWDEITRDEIVGEIHSMPWRIHECYNRRGGITHW